MDRDDSGDAPELDEITLLRLPPPDAAERIPDERTEHLAAGLSPSGVGSILNASGHLIVRTE